MLGGVLTSVSKDMSEAIEAKVEYDFRQSNEIFRREQKLRYDSLLDAAWLIGENTSFKGNVKLKDGPSVYHIVERLSLFTRVDLFLVTDDDGNLLAWLGDPQRQGESMASRESVARALEGLDPDEDAPPPLWHVDIGLCQTVTVPIWLSDDQIIGTVTLGSLIGEYEAHELKGPSQIDITFVSRGRLIAATDSTLTEEEIAVFEKGKMGTVQEVLKSGVASSVFELPLAGEKVFAFISPFGRGEEAYLLATAKKSNELAILRVIQRGIYETAAASMLITVLLALVIGRTVTRPVLRLAGAMNQVKEGDLGVSVEATTGDEVGQLTSTFNDMLVNLRERLQLMRYVGSHTMEMIHEASGEDVSMGGTTQDLAVLFTDLRGFTAYSEHREPDEVIAMLNRYLGFQAEIVPDFGGSIDKFVGDEMMALFIGDDALARAIACSVAIQRRVEVEHKTDPAPVHVGIGINHGPATLGNMGAQNRLDYTAIGATVNLGARLMQIAAPGQTLLPESLLADLREVVPIKATEMMEFKGFSDPIGVADIDNAAYELPAKAPAGEAAGG